MATGQNITEAENNDLKVWYLFNYFVGSENFSGKSFIKYVLIHSSQHDSFSAAPTVFYHQESKTVWR